MRTDGITLDNLDAVHFSTLAGVVEDTPEITAAVAPDPALRDPAAFGRPLIGSSLVRSAPR